MAPPQVIISQPRTDNSNNNSLLSSFLSSKMLNETMNLNRSNMTNVEPTRTEQPSYFNAIESIIPELPNTPIKQEVKPPTGTGPPRPRPPPPPITPIKKKDSPKELNLTGLSGRDAMLAELKFAQSDEGKAEKARKKAETTAKTEAKPFEKETAPNPDKAAIKLQEVIRGKITRNKISNEIGQMETQIAGIENLVQKKQLILKKNKAASQIQALQRGIKTRNKLSNNADFQNKIDMKIKKYSDAASEFSTRGKDPPKVNKEFSDIMKTMRTGLQTYKKTLGVNPKKRGPKPQQQSEI
jgi:hypothetical protein